MRLLTPGDYGLLSLATIFTALLALIAEAGLSAGVVQSPNVSIVQLRQVFGAVIAMNVSLCLLTAFVLAPIAASYFEEPRLQSIMHVLALQFILNASAVLPAALLQRELKFRGISLIELAAAIGGSLLSLALAYHGFGVWALVLGTMMQIALRAVSLNVLRPFLHKPLFSIAGAQHLFVFGGNVMLSRLLWFTYSQSDIFIVGKLLGKAELGLYSVSMHLASLPVQRVSSIVNQIAFPAFAKLQGDRVRVARAFLTSVRIQLVFSIPILWGISCVAPEAVYVILGPSWQGAILPMQILTLMMPLRMTSNLMPAALQGVGRVDLEVRGLLVLWLLMPAAFFFASRWGVEGVSLAWVLVFPIAFAINLSFSLPVLGVGRWRFVGTVLRSALPGVPMYAAVLLARAAIGPVTPITLLGALAFVGAATYALAVFILNREGLREVRQVRWVGKRV
jgi:O-antigen/teichoic acid export membrane protein